MQGRELSSGQVARLLGIPARTIRSYLSSGRLPAVQNPVTGRWRVRRRDLTEFMRANGVDADRMVRPLKVLVLDRDERTAHQVRKALFREGLAVSVESFADVLPAMIRVGDRPPDLVIVDEQTAEGYCERLAEALTESERTRSVRVLFLYLPESRRAAWSRVHRRLSKPLRSDQLAEEMKQVLSRRLVEVAFL